MNDTRYYLGKYKVKVVTQSLGYLIVEALEEFEDNVDGEKVKVAVGERRIVPIDAVHGRKYLAPPVKEHAYELQMEKKLKQLIENKEKAQNSEKE
jgi:hypothetical protein